MYKTIVMFTYHSNNLNFLFGKLVIRNIYFRDNGFRHIGFGHIDFRKNGHSVKWIRENDRESLMLNKDFP